jgi:hypothetical protein
MTQAIEWVTYEGRVLYDPDGNPIGTIEEFYIDSDDDQPTWALVATGPADAALCFVPLRDARISQDADDLQVSVTGDEVSDAPSIQRGGELSSDDERLLYQHYDMPYPGRDPETAGEPAGDARDQSDSDQGPGKRLPRFLRRFLHRDRDN